MTTIREGLYHRAYPLAQQLHIVGAWALTESMHTQAITDSITTRSPAVLYCGTATARNPKDAQEALAQSGFEPSLTAMDVSSRPLADLPANVTSVQANATQIPFESSSFDVITTDFLFNMMDLQVVKRTAQEWARVLKSDGVITTTSYLANRRQGIDTSYKRFLYGVGFRSFFSQEALDIALQCSGLETSFTPFSFDKKPLLYPNSPHHLTIKKRAGEVTQSDAQQIWEDAEAISSATTNAHGVSPRQISEVISGIVAGNYTIRRDNKGILGFAGTQPLIEGWHEFGPAHIRLEGRGNGLGTELIRERIQAVPGNNLIGFTNNPVAMRILEAEGFKKHSLRTLPRSVVKAVAEDRLRTSPRTLATAKVALSGSKTILVRSAE